MTYACTTRRQVVTWSAVTAVFFSLTAPHPMTIAQTRYRFFISDLHLGVGRDDQGAWRNFEDFRWAPELAGFLAEIDRRGGGTTDLIVVGDAFELWQSIADDCIYPSKDWGCNEKDALARMNRVIATHDTELKSIGDFARKGSNRVIFIPGNHDAALLFPSVASRAIAATGAPDRVSVAASGSWVSEDGAIIAEHGHQIGQEVNRFDGWPQPFLGTPPHLRRPWGEQFVQNYYNDFEKKYPIIDNILSEGVGIHYAAQAEGRLGTAAEIHRLAWFLLTKLSWTQFRGALGPEGAAIEWDFAAVRKQGGQFLVDSYPPGDPVRQAMEQAAKEQPGSVSLDGFTDDDIREICEARAALSAPEPAAKLLAAPPPCPTKTLGAVAQAALRRSRNKVLGAHLQEVASAQQNRRALQLFIYGHTHAPESAFMPMAGNMDDWQPVAINTGAWQRVVHPEVLEKWRETTHSSHGQALALQPSALPACYSFVAVAPYAAAPNAQLAFWTQQGGPWQYAPSCPAVMP